MAEILSLDINELLKEDERATKDPVAAFRSSVKSSEALEGLRIAKKAMDLIIFHRNIQKEFNNIINEKKEQKSLLFSLNILLNPQLIQWLTDYL